MARGGAGRSPANTEGTPVASWASSRRSSPLLELRRLEWERERKRKELEDRAKERENWEKQQQHELELASAAGCRCPAEIGLYHPSGALRVPDPAFRPQGSAGLLPAPGGPAPEGGGGFGRGVYIADTCVFSQTWEDHVSQVRQVLDRLQGAGLTVKAEKCKVGMVEVSYLGHQVGSGRLKPEPAKVEGIRDWPGPHTKKQVQAFIGMAGCYRRFVPHFSSVATPITELCKKGKPDKVVWTEQCQEAFRALKEALVSGPVLANPDFDKPFVVFTDASDTGLGAVLMQEDEKGERHPIVYLSKKLLPREQHYAAIEKECLAMVWALKKPEPYLFGRHFTVYTDHSPLTWLHQMKGANAKLLRWSLLLQDYDMDVGHVKGRANVMGDALSRRGGPELPQVTGHSDPAQFSLEGGSDVTEQGGGRMDLGMLGGSFTGTGCIGDGVAGGDFT
ncbi:unnamed protein product [Eretmochelys imbricata]